ncbi:WxL domain-containing protein [Listeria grandensis]|uniref:WxL domain-containing protein n=1 Tax=Listeria grandensis TaxID=1494963 RepID=A0A7X1CQ14_9LIST|nr:WxL domain-containing protein [Listeria grandensis]MBC1936565.1 WxL domain-containing protein [Listeria grandensis]
MKKLSIMTMTGILAMATAGNTVLATSLEGADSATSEASINILPGTGVTDPEIVNPIDPEEPTIPVDPINPNPGALRINHVSDLNFGDVTLSGRKETLHAKKVKTKTDQELPAFINIADLRGTGDGWSLKVSQEGELVRGGELAFQPEYNGTDEGIQTVGGTLAKDGDEIDLMIAKENAGMGSHSALLGGLDGVTLTIPKDATAGQQQASLNWNIVADPSTTIPDEVVGIPDNNLRTAIKEALGVTNDNQITKANLEKLTEFTAEGKDIVDLKGIEYATNLTKLVLDNNKITNEGIVPAISLAKLVTVEISGNRIMDGKILSDWAPPLISSKPLERINAHNQNLGRTLAATNPEDIALLDLKWSGGKETLQMRNLIRNSQGNYATLYSVTLDGSNSGIDFNFIDNQNFQVENIPLGTGSLEYRAAWGTQKLGFSAFVKVDNLDVQIEE